MPTARPSIRHAPHPRAFGRRQSVGLRTFCHLRRRAAAAIRAQGEVAKHRRAQFFSLHPNRRFRRPFSRSAIMGCARFGRQSRDAAFGFARFPAAVASRFRRRFVRCRIEISRMGLLAPRHAHAFGDRFDHQRAAPRQSFGPTFGRALGRRARRQTEPSGAGFDSRRASKPPKLAPKFSRFPIGISSAS